MITWHLMESQKPSTADKMYLVQETAGQVIQAYWCGEKWHIAWGAVYDEADQPKCWAELNYPRFL